MNTRPFRVGLSCLLLALAAGAARADEPAAKAPQVPVARPVAREVTDHEDFTGRAEAPTRVDLRARASGYLVKVLFEEGDDVKQGDVLFEIDPRPYKAELDRAEAAVSLAEARLKLADANQKRATAGLAAKSVSREEYDKVVAERTVAEAELRAARAGHELAQLNLEFTRVVAPVSGQIGRRLVDVGNVVKADDTNLAVLVTRDPVHVYFDVDERTLLRLRRSMTEGKFKADKLTVGIGLADEERFPHRGVLDFADNRVDPETGTIRLRAVLPNKNRLVVPGMFVRVRLPLGEPHKVLLVPAQAVTTEGGARFIFVVGDKDVIERRPVVLGQTYDAQRAVTEGLKAEDRVVVGRLEGLRPGMAVQPVQADAPAPKPAPPPEGAPPTRTSTGPGILVEAVYPGASAAVVADTVRAPIEQQLSDMERLRYLRSRCTNDGRYTLQLAFARGTDLKRAHLLVWNRVNVATVQLPEEVRNAGVTAKHGTSGVLMVVSLFSAEGRYDELYLSNYANIQIRDELARLAGVGEVTLIGAGDYSLRVRLDLHKLAAHNLSAGEVARLIQKQKELGAGDALKLEDVILKADGEGRVIRLKDVAAVELGARRRQSQASLDGKAVAALVIHPTGEVRPQTLCAAVRDRLTLLRAHLPRGLDLDVAFDFTANLEAPNRPTTPEYLLLDLDFPAGTSTERIFQGLSRCEALLRRVPGVQHVLALSENSFDLFGSGPCVLAQLTPAGERKAAREEVILTLRTRLDEVKEMRLRVRDLSGPGRFPRCGYPIDLAVSAAEPERLREWAGNLAERLGKTGKLTDVRVSPDLAPQAQRYVDVDRTKAAAMGVSVEDVFDTLRVYGGSLYVNDFQRFGRTWRVEIQSEVPAEDWAKGVQKLRVRNSRGQMVPLATIVTIRETEGPLALDFLDLRPMVQITANPAPGVSPEQARKLCEAMAAEVLPADCRLTWLHEAE
jgi:RND family efflux transporter MFP subunit